MKKLLKLSYILFFFLLCLTPLALLLILPQSEPIGKEEKAEQPQLIKENAVNKSFSDDCEKWFTQMIPFRSDIITAQNKVSSGLLGQESNNVIVGSNGHLFSDETVNDYVGVTVSDREIHNIAKTVSLMQTYTENHGANFVFTVAPNKNTVYPEYMPFGYIRGGKSNLSLLERELKKQNVNYVDLEDTLKAQKKNGTELYLKNDTHWNALAAVYGYNAIMQGLGGDYKPYNGLSYSVKNDWVGDLSKMLYPSAPSTCNQYYFDMSYDQIQFMKPRTLMKNEELMENLMSDKEEHDTLIQTRNRQGKGSVYISRDSFCRAMLPFFIDNYSKTYITRYRSFDLTNIDTMGYNDVVYEMVERKLDSITDIAPLVYALPAQNPSATELAKDKATVKIQQNDNGTKIYGVIDSDKLKTDSNIYVVLSDGNTKQYYEAFPITETELLGLDNKTDCGFTALVDSSKLPKNLKEYTVSVAVS